MPDRLFSNIDNANQELILMLNFINKTAIIVGKPGEWKITQLFPDGRVELENLQSNKKTIIDNGDSIRYALD